MNAVREMLRTLRSDQRGATAIEYGLLVGLIAIAMIGGLTVLGGGSGGLWTGINDDVSAAVSAVL